jgi:hypothetical protein
MDRRQLCITEQGFREHLLNPGEPFVTHVTIHSAFDVRREQANKRQLREKYMQQKNGVAATTQDVLTHHLNCFGDIVGTMAD